MGDLTGLTQLYYFEIQLRFACFLRKLADMSIPVDAEEQITNIDELELTEKQRKVLSAQILLSQRMGKPAVFRFKNKLYRVVRVSSNVTKGSSEAKQLLYKRIRGINK